MQQILFVLIGLWLLKGVYDLGLGLAQILLGILCGIGGALLIALSYPVEGIEKLIARARK